MAVLESECGRGGRDGRRGGFSFFIVVVERVWDGGPIEHDLNRMGRKVWDSQESRKNRGGTSQESQGNKE